MAESDQTPKELRKLRMGEREGEPKSDSSAAAELSALLNAAVDAIVIIDDNGIIMEFNPAAQTLFSYEADEIIGQPVHCLMPEPDRTRHGDYMQHYIETGERRIIGIGREVKGLKKGGEVFPLWLSVGEALNNDRRHFVGILRDLSAQHAAAEEQHVLETQLADVGRFSLMGEMAAGIAHEINQPLSAIGTYAQAARRLLDNEELDQESLAKACHGIGDQVQRAGEVIANLRNFIGNQEVKKEILNLNEVIQGAMSLIIADAKSAGIAIKTQCAAGLPPIEGNAIQLQQVLLNLTHNAVDAMRGSVAANKVMSIATMRSSNSELQFRVSDRGPGVSQHLAAGIFNPFVTTKREGLGVGLAISQTIVQAHLGELKYEDNPGGGAVFIVSLPVYHGQRNV